MYINVIIIIVIVVSAMRISSTEFYLFYSENVRDFNSILHFTVQFLADIFGKKEFDHQNQKLPPKLVKLLLKNPLYLLPNLKFYHQVRFFWFFGDIY